jgi:hypothetical protein
MRKVERSELLPLGEYEAIRERFRARIIQEKKDRRLALGPHMSAVFENHDTALYQIQEMLRTERITREGAILHELETYNELVPGEGELSATLFVEIPEATLRDRMLVELAGLEPCFALDVNGEKLRARNETRGTLPDRTTAVHYVRFPLSPAAQAAIAAGQATVKLVADHPRYQHETTLGPATLASLRADLE